MRKIKREQNSSKELTVKALLADVFGLNRSEEQKARSRKEIPWQWALWGGLLLFCIGFLVPTESLWIILLAVGVAVIIYMARSSEAVEPQVFLLTDNRTAEQKGAFERRTNRARPRRQTRSPKAETEKATDVTKPVEEVAEVTVPKAKSARKPRKPRAPKIEASVENVVVAEPVIENAAAKASANPASEVAEEKPTVDAKTEDMTETKAITKKSRARRPRNTNTSGVPRTTTAPRRPRKPKVQAALTTPPVATDAKGNN